MCLVKVREEEDVVIPVRVTDRRRRRSQQSVRRVSRTEIIRDASPRASYVAVPAPKPLAIPAPQPVPIFYEPPPAPIPIPAPPPPPSVSHHSTHHARQSAHYVEVSPRSSVSSSSSSEPSRSDYVVHEREYRRRQRRDYSPPRHEERSPRYEHFRYVEPPPSESAYEPPRRRSQSRVRERSVSRGGRDYGERVTRERITINSGDGRRASRDYRR